MEREFLGRKFYSFTIEALGHREALMSARGIESSKPIDLSVGNNVVLALNVS
jgi:hypothetical protein